MSGANLLVLGGTQAAAPAVYIEDVFSTYLYAGTGSAQTITNNIDLSSKGGAVWSKQRTGVGSSHVIVDTVRGVGKTIYPDDTSAEFSGGSPIQTITAFNNNGYSLGTNANFNRSGDNFVSWTFRKAEKFFDVVTYTGNGTSGRTVAHNLGSVPGCIIVKKTSNTDDWQVYHRSLGNTKFLVLNTTAAESTGSDRWNSTTPTSTEFTVGNAPETNQNGATYVAYLFAHDAGGFGTAGSDNVISCGSYTGNGSATGPTVTLGYEPQWVLVKRTDSTSNWTLSDNMRGQPVDGATAILNPNLSDAETSATTAVSPTATGFQVKTAGTTFNANGGTYIYIAIRRGPMKTPTTGTSVFTPVTRTGTGANATVNASILTDTTFIMDRSPTWQAAKVFDRLRGATTLVYSNTTSAEVSDATTLTSFANMTGYVLGDDSANYDVNRSASSYINWNFSRAPGFFDVVCYTGTGSNTTISHNLGVAPELMIVKRRETANAWAVYANNDNTDYLVLNTTAATVDDNTYWNDTSPTSSVFSVGTNNATNASGSTYVAYLFASLSGVSKVGSYTGTGTTLQVNCGFTNGSRFVLIKRTDSTGDWYVWDSARGIVAGNDPYLLLNSLSAEVTNTDYVDTYSAGFEISSTAPAAINANGGTFIFLAIA